MNCAILLAAALAGAIPSSNTFHSVVETSRGWALRAGDGRLWRARGIEKANGYGPNCGALGRPYADSIKKEGLSRAKWCARTSSRLKEWGFNLLGTACDSQINSDGGFAETEMIALSSWMRDKGDEYLLKVNPNSPCTPMANVFHPEFADVCEKAAKACCSKWRGKTGFLGYYLNYMFRDVHVVTASGASEMFEKIVGVGPEDVVIAFSFPRYPTTTAKGAQYCRSTGATVIGMTDSRLSPLGQNCDHVLLVKSDMVSLVDSLVAPLSVTNALIVAIAARREKELSKTFDNLEHIWEEYNVYEKQEDQV